VISSREFAYIYVNFHILEQWFSNMKPLILHVMAHLAALDWFGYLTNYSDIYGTEKPT
jgi:hypothetical protein